MLRVGLGGSDGRDCSLGSLTTESTASGADDLTAPVRITHPFHPLFGQELDLVIRRHNWGEDRVFHRDRNGHTASLPTRWTSAVPDDPFLVVSAGRSTLRVDDLLELVALLRRPVR
jgi:hypothetical protein